MENDYYEIFIIYGIALVFNLLLLKYYNYNRITTVILLITLIVITLNAYLSYKDPIHTFEVEINTYDYVEKNAEAVMSIVTAICLLTLGLFALLSNMKTNTNVNIPITFFRNFALALLFSILIKLIIWMPKSKGKPIRTLRDIKTMFLTFGIVFLLYILYDFYLITQSLAKFISNKNNIL